MQRRGSAERLNHTASVDIAVDRHYHGVSVVPVPSTRSSTRELGLRTNGVLFFLNVNVNVDVNVNDDDHHHNNFFLHRKHSVGGVESTSTSVHTPLV
jgi:hypothetical protein